MLPLRSDRSPDRIPTSLIIFLSGFVVLDIVSRLWPGGRLDFLAQVAFLPADAGEPRGFLSFLFFPHPFSLAVNLLFAYVFSPVFWTSGVGILKYFGVGLSGVIVSLLFFAKIHPFSPAPILCPEAFFGAILGAYMRRDIWGNVSTLVVGFVWLRVYAVPSYVLLFFWFFYLLIGNLFLPEPFSSSPMLYSLSGVAFLWGFAVESVLPAKGR